MAFIRIKKIKGIEYAYLVENKWTKKGTRQSTKSYFGKLINLKKKKTMSFEDFIKKGQIKLHDLSTIEIIKNLFLWELKNHGFKDKKDKLILKEIIFDPKTLSLISKKNKKIVLKLNNEYMCNHTITNLLNFYVEGDEEFIGLELAKAFVASALTIPQETFIHIFERIYKDEKAQIQ